MHKIGFAQAASIVFYIAIMLALYFTEHLDNIAVESAIYLMIFLFLAFAIIAISNIQRTSDDTKFTLFIALGAALIALAIASYLVLGNNSPGRIRDTAMAFFASMLIASIYAFSRVKRKIDMTDKTSFGYVE
jgi:uncharacterized membrane protein